MTRKSPAQRRVPAPRDASYTMRISEELKAAIQAAALDDRRTMAQYVEKVLTDHLTKEGYLKV